MGMDCFCEELLDAANGLGVPIDAGAAHGMLRFLDALYEENHRVNLTSIPEGRDAVYLHLLDALLPLSLSQERWDKHSTIDIGTGCGVPGVPFGIATGYPVVLLDSVSRKIDALKRILRATGFSQGFKPTIGRAEDFALENDSIFDIVLARAVAPLNVTLEYATPLLTMEGIFISYKAMLSSDEYGRGLAAANILGLDCVSRETFELPKGYGTRTISCWRRKREAKIELPRRTGMARKRPLGTEK